MIRRNFLVSFTSFFAGAFCAKYLFPMGSFDHFKGLTATPKLQLKSVVSQVEVFIIYRSNQPGLNIPKAIDGLVSKEMSDVFHKYSSEGKIVHYNKRSSGQTFVNHYKFDSPESLKSYFTELAHVPFVQHDSDLKKKISVSYAIV